MSEGLQLKDWAVEYGAAGVILYRADEYTMRVIVDIQRRCGGGGNVQLRPATPEDLEEEGKYLTVIPPDCKDWFLITGFGESIHRNTTLGEIINLANQAVGDGFSTVGFRPASPDEIAKHDAENRRRTVIRKWVATGLVVILPYLASVLPGNWAIAALGAAGVLALTLAWVGLKWALYQISFAIGSGFKAGRKG